MLNFINKKFLIYGYGMSGKSCLNYLKKKNSVKIFDDNLKKNFQIKKYVIKKKNLIKTNFDYIILSPGIDINKCSIKKYLNKNKKKVVSDLDLFSLIYNDNLKITITGTNGKSTTAKLIYEILKYAKKDVRLVGNIGKPVLNERKVKPKTIFVIEASSYQIEYSKYYVTDIALFLNISPDHLERHGTFSKYISAKIKLITKQNSNGIAFICKDNKFLNKYLRKKKVKCKIITVSPNFNNNLKLNIKNNYFNNSNNLTNLKFALEVSKLFNIKYLYIKKAIRNFKGLNFRQQILFNNKKLQIINDSKSTSFSSSINLLKSFKNIYWILGGLKKKGDKFNMCQKYFKNINAYIIGNDFNFFKKKLENKINLKLCYSLKNALNQIVLDVKNQKFKVNIIFSPSAASFDQFKSFEDRGKYFNSIIKKINFINRINAK